MARNTGRGRRPQQRGRGQGTGGGHSAPRGQSVVAMFEGIARRIHEGSFWSRMDPRWRAVFSVVLDIIDDAIRFIAVASTIVRFALMHGVLVLLILAGSAYLLGVGSAFGTVWATVKFIWAFWTIFPAPIMIGMLIVIVVKPLFEFFMSILKGLEIFLAVWVWGESGSAAAIEEAVAAVFKAGWVFDFLPSMSIAGVRHCYLELGDFRMARQVNLLSSGLLFGVLLAFDGYYLWGLASYWWLLGIGGGMVVAVWAILSAAVSNAEAETCAEEDEDDDDTGDEPAI